VLLAVMASMYAVYHGPQGLKRIAQRVHRLTATLAAGLKRWARAAQRHLLRHADAGDRRNTEAFHASATARGINLRHVAPRASASRSTKRTARRRDRAVGIFAHGKAVPDFDAIEASVQDGFPAALRAERVPDAPGVQHAPRRTRDAALPARAGRQGPGARPHDDPAGLLHHEAQRHQRDDPGHVARVRNIHPFAPPTRPPAIAK
jgi:hypothetical protein